MLQMISRLQFLGQLDFVRVQIILFLKMLNSLLGVRFQCWAQWRIKVFWDAATLSRTRCFRREVPPSTSRSRNQSDQICSLFLKLCARKDGRVYWRNCVKRLNCCNALLNVQPCIAPRFNFQCVKIPSFKLKQKALMFFHSYLSKWWDFCLNILY